jgi:SAM-dependent methyltransferase
MKEEKIPWDELHQNYKEKDWIDRPNVFAQEVLKYFPDKARVLGLGDGQGQDARFFAEHGHDVVSTDISDLALEESKAKLSPDLEGKVSLMKLDLEDEFPFEQNEFDVVYAHLSLHYFDEETTKMIIQEIYRVLKGGGVLALLCNSTSDPEYGTGEKIESDYFLIDGKKKRYFSAESLGQFTESFRTIMLDNQGKTHKDKAKGVANLIRFVGSKSDK